MTTFRHVIVASLAVAAFACAGDPPSGGGGDDDTETLPDPDQGNAAGGEDNTFDHPDTQANVWDLLERLQEEGPPRYTARVHSCPKMRYSTVGAILASRGVDLTNVTALSAGELYEGGYNALGGSNYAARVRENPELTASSASKLFDIFVQAAPEIIANMPNRAECTVGGEGARLFNDAGQCSARGISCLIGVPATAGHVELCNEIVNRASTPERGRIIATASLAAAAHTCE